MSERKKLKIAIVGSGLSGLSCAWLLAPRHKVVVFEKNHYSGAISPAFDQPERILDASLMTCSSVHSPNLLALAQHLDLHLQRHTTEALAFFAGLNTDALESACWLNSPGDFKIKLKYRRQLKRFLAHLKQAKISTSSDQNLAQWAQSQGFSTGFMRYCIWPMTAILGNYSFAQALLLPAQSLLNALLNLGLGDPNDVYYTANNSLIPALSRHLGDAQLQTNRAVKQLRRLGGKVFLEDHLGDNWQFDHVVFCCNATQALRLLSDPRTEEKAVLKAFKLQRQHVVLHLKKQGLRATKPHFAYANFSSATQQQATSLEYCLNYPAKLGLQRPIMLTLNPLYRIPAQDVITSYVFDRVVFAADSQQRQAELWQLQGQHNTWFGGAWTGLGFNEDAVLAGLCIAEALSGCKRPWTHRELQVDRLSLPADWHQRHYHHALVA